MRGPQLCWQTLGGHGGGGALPGASWGEPCTVDHHIKLSAAAGVGTHSVVLVEIYLAGMHHFPAHSHTVGELVELLL